MPALVATDLDGTLLRSDGAVSQRTRQVLDALWALGVHVAFVSARPLRWMDPLWHVVGDRGLAVASNGAVLYDVEGRQVVDLAEVERTAGLRILADLAEAIPGVGLGIERLPSGMARNEAYVADRGAVGLPDQHEVGDLADLWTEPVVKLLVRTDDLDPEELRRRAGLVVGRRALCTWSVDGLVEVSAAGVTKAWRLRQLAARLGVDAADVWAFGDMPNDLPMLEWAGHPYAVANAHGLLAGRFGAAPSNDEDGVAAILTEQFRLSG